MIRKKDKPEREPVAGQPVDEHLGQWGTTDADRSGIRLHEIGKPKKKGDEKKEE